MSDDLSTDAAEWVGVVQSSVIISGVFFVLAVVLEILEVIGATANNPLKPLLDLVGSTLGAGEGDAPDVELPNL
jgi:hypothetical protein